MPDVTDLLMPKLGLTMTEGTIASWVAAPGQKFAAGDVIVIVETDKIANEVEAPAAGELISLLSAEGEIVPVGAAIARWRLDAGPKRPAETPEAVMEPRATRTSTDPPFSTVASLTPPTNATRIVATPYARRLAREASLDLSLVAGSGPRGRIKAADVQRARESRPEQQAIVPAAAAMQRVPSRGRETAPVHSFATADVDVSALRLLDARLSGDRDRPFERTPYIALACIKAFEGEIENPVRLGILVNGKIVRLKGEARDTLSAVVARLARNEMHTGEGDVAIFIVEGKVRQFVPVVPEGWRMSIGIGGIRAVCGGDDTHEMTVSLVYDGTAVDHDLSAERLTRIAALLEEPLHLLSV